MNAGDWRMGLEPAEPGVEQWQLVPIEVLLDTIEARRGREAPVIVAIDGRSASGKSTLAGRLADRLPEAVVVHTDDLAWNEPLFQWQHLLRDGILRPARAGGGVTYTPPAWRERGRPGAIDVPATTRILLIEGVGAGHAGTSGLADLVIWVQSDRNQAERRGLERDLASGVNGDAEATRAFWNLWDEAECRYLADDRPWERADLVVAGTSPQPLPEGIIAIAAGPLPAVTPERSGPGSRPGRGE